MGSPIIWGFSPPGLLSLSSNPVCLFSLFISMPRSRLPMAESPPKEDPPKRRCSTCQHFLRAADPHQLCVIHRSCNRYEPCELDSAWSSEQWDELEQRQAEIAHKIQERKDKPPAHLQCRVPHLLYHSSSRNSQTSPRWCVRQLQRPWRGYLNGWPCWRVPWVVVRRRMKKPGIIASTIRPQQSIGVILQAPWESSTSSGSSAGHPRAPCGEQWTSSEEPWRPQPQQWQPPQPW